MKHAPLAILMCGLAWAAESEQPRSAATELAKALRDEDPNVRLDAAKALGRLGAAAREAVPALAQALQDDDARVREEAAGTLARVGSPHAVPAIPALIAILSDENPRVRGMAALALGTMGAAAKEAVPALVKAAWVPDRDPRTGGIYAARIMVIKALRKIAGPEALPTLSKLARDEDANVRYTAMRMLEEIGKEQEAMQADISAEGTKALLKEVRKLRAQLTALSKRLDALEAKAAKLVEGQEKAQ